MRLWTRLVNRFYAAVASAPPESKKMCKKDLADCYKSMSRTEYLFGVDSSHFPEQEAFARRRILKAKQLRAKMSYVDVSSFSREDLQELYARNDEVVEAQKWAEKLLDEALGAMQDDE